MKLRFSIRDTGIGIAPENQDKIFEAFSQEDSSVNRKYGGTGLGLAISRKLLLLMGSDLKLQSIPGKGSIFFFDLEVSAQNGEAEVWADSDNLKKILIVDDNDNNRRILKDMLAIKNINSEEAENGSEALNKIKSGNRYDAILMDYHMPVLDGIETTRCIRRDLLQDAQSLPVLLLHSSAEDGSITAACRELEIVRNLVKPIKMSQLFNVLSHLKRMSNDPDPAIQPERRGNATKAPTMTNSHTGDFKILVADDNAINILLIKEMINNMLPDAQIMEAENGIKAVEIFKKENPDLIFMDIQMPEMNGYEATSCIRELEHNSRIPIIALTAATLKDEKDRCLEAGMDDFVTKPVVTTSIENVIQYWLHLNSN